MLSGRGGAIRALPRRPALVALAIALLVTALGLGVARATAVDPEPWPSFTMVYRDARFGDRPFTQTLRLTYTDSRHYKVVLLVHSSAPEAVGWTHVRDGDVSQTVDARFGAMPTGILKPGEQTSPDFWIRPDTRPLWLANRPGASTEKVAGGLLRTTSVSLDGGRLFTQALTYRPDDGIPLGYLETVDGREVRRVEVLELELGP